MSKPVLFVTGLGRELKRAENMNAMYESYQGEKTFISMKDMNYNNELHSGKYGLVVVDIFPTEHPVKTVMMWHCIQGGKYIGLDEKNTYYKESYARFMDYIIVAGGGGIDMFEQCTHVPRERIIDLGLPRTDRYFKRKKDIKRSWYAKDKRVYFYAPTFRNWGETPSPCIAWRWIDNELNEDELLIVKPHPYGTECDISGHGYKHIIEIDKMKPSINCLYDCDVLITDYSSIMFDALLMKKPVVLFEKNPGYTKTRGMYLDYPKQYSSRYAKDEVELLNLCRSAKKLSNAEKRCIDYVADACDGHSCERICKFIDEIKE